MSEINDVVRLVKAGEIVGGGSQELIPIVVDAAQVDREMGLGLHAAGAELAEPVAASGAAGSRLDALAAELNRRVAGQADDPFVSELIARLAGKQREIPLTGTTGAGKTGIVDRLAAEAGGEAIRVDLGKDSPEVVNAKVFGTPVSTAAYHDLVPQMAGRIDGRSVWLRAAAHMAVASGQAAARVLDTAAARASHAEPAVHAATAKVSDAASGARLLGGNASGAPRGVDEITAALEHQSQAERLGTGAIVEVPA